MKPYGPGVPLVADSSAWLRQRDAAFAGRWKATVDADLVVVCPVASLEILAAARDSLPSPRSTAPLPRFRTFL